MRLILAVLVALAAISTVKAQSPNIQDPSAERNGNNSGDSTGSVVGTVEMITTGAGEIEVEDGDGNKKTYKVENAPIMSRRNESIDISQLRTGDRVMVEVDKAQKVTRVAVVE